MKHIQQQEFFHLPAPKIHKVLQDSDAQSFPRFGLRFETQCLNACHMHSATIAKNDQDN